MRQYTASLRTAGPGVEHTSSTRLLDYSTDSVTSDRALSFDNPDSIVDVTLSGGIGNYRGRLNGDVYGKNDRLDVEQSPRLRLSMINTSNVWRPMHLHGHTFRTASDLGGALNAADDIGYPVVVKTAATDVHHKSDVSGVVLDIANSARLTAAYTDISQRLGPNVLIAAITPTGCVALDALVIPKATSVVDRHTGAQP